MSLIDAYTPQQLFALLDAMEQAREQGLCRLRAFTERQLGYGYVCRSWALPVIDQGREHLLDLTGRKFEIDQVYAEMLQCPWAGWWIELSKYFHDHKVRKPETAAHAILVQGDLAIRLGLEAKKTFQRFDLTKNDIVQGRARRMPMIDCLTGIDLDSNELELKYNLAFAG